MTKEPYLVEIIGSYVGCCTTPVDIEMLGTAKPVRASTTMTIWMRIPAKVFARTPYPFTSAPPFSLLQHPFPLPFVGFPATPNSVADSPRFLVGISNLA